MDNLISNNGANMCHSRGSTQLSDERVKIFNESTEKELS